MGFSAPCADSARPPGTRTCQRGFLQQLLTHTSHLIQFDTFNSYFYQHPRSPSFETKLNLFLRDPQYKFYVANSWSTPSSIDQLRSASRRQKTILLQDTHHYCYCPSQGKESSSSSSGSTTSKDETIVRLKTHWYDCHPLCAFDTQQQVTSSATYSASQTSPLLHHTSLHVISVLSVLQWLAPKLDPRICKKQILPSFYSYYSQRLLQNSPKLGQRNGLTPFFISSLVALLPCNLRVSMYHCVRMPSWCLVRKLGTTCVTLRHRNQTAGTAHEHSSSSCLSKSLVHCWTKADGRLLQEDQDRASMTTYNDTVVPPNRELSFYV